MIQLSLARLKQGHRTIPYPATVPTLPDRFRGLPVVDESKCLEGCRACAEACPTDAIDYGRPVASQPDKWIRIDLGRCVFCTACSEACPTGAIAYSQDHRLATRTREDLVLRGKELALAKSLDEQSLRLFGRSLKLRQVSAGGCNACEADLNVLSTVVFDLGRFGIQFVASPRHADGVVITGPVTENMRQAMLAADAAVPRPKLVIAVGACAISGGLFRDNPEAHNGCSTLLPVDLYIPGCPPHPLTILDGLLRLLNRLPTGK